MDAYTLPTNSYDLILGVQWLANLGDIIWILGANHAIFGGAVTISFARGKINGVKFDR